MAQVGSYTLHTIETGRFALDGGAMFGIVPKPLWERRIAADDRNRIPLAMRCLLLKGEGRVALVDCGLGDVLDDTFRERYAVDYDASELHRSLAEAGVAAEEVTDLILTHLHFDHAGGVTRRADEGVRVLTFPNARHHVQRAHWRWARDPAPKEARSFWQEDLDVLEASGQLRLVDGEAELLPGVHAMLVNGHTRAQQMVRIDGPERPLVFVADLVPTTAHLGPAWTMAYDVEPLVTGREKQAFLERALEGEWVLFFEHDPAVARARLAREDGRIRAIRAGPL